MQVWRAPSAGVGAGFARHHNIEALASRQPDSVNTGPFCYAPMNSLDKPNSTLIYKFQETKRPAVSVVINGTASSSSHFWAISCSMLYQHKEGFGILLQGLIFQPFFFRDLQWLWDVLQCQSLKSSSMVSSPVCLSCVGHHMRPWLPHRFTEFLGWDIPLGFDANAGKRSEILSSHLSQCVADFKLLAWYFPLQRVHLPILMTAQVRVWDMTAIAQYILYIGHFILNTIYIIQ